MKPTIEHSAPLITPMVHREMRRWQHLIPHLRGAMRITTLWLLGLLAMTNNRAPIAISIALFLLSCHGEAKENSPNIAAKISTIPEFPRQFTLEIYNKGKRPICITDDQINAKDMNISFEQAGTRLDPVEEDNRPIREYKSVNIYSKMNIVLPGFRDFYVDTNNYNIKAGVLNIEGSIRAFDCLSFFRDKSPGFGMVKVRGQVVIR